MERVREFFGGDAQEWDDVDSLEITMKPSPRRDISTAVRQVVNNLPDNGLERFIVRAKDDLHDRLIDHYLAGQGQLSDAVAKGSDSDILTVMQQTMSNNTVLQDKVREYEADEQFQRQDVQRIHHFHDANEWAATLADL